MGGGEAGAHAAHPDGFCLLMTKHHTPFPSFFHDEDQSHLESTKAGRDSFCYPPGQLLHQDPDLHPLAHHTLEGLAQVPVRGALRSVPNSPGPLPRCRL